MPRNKWEHYRKIPQGMLFPDIFTGNMVSEHFGKIDHAMRPLCFPGQLVTKFLGCTLAGAYCKTKSLICIQRRAGVKGYLSLEKFHIRIF